MKHQDHFGYVNRSRDAKKTQTLISDIGRVVQILNLDIADEEEKARVFDRSQAEYPLLARTLATRRDNLKGTIAALEAAIRPWQHRRGHSES
jgi:hypothetical protein